ncbi:(deoxy)nucleoside triphosphate pyrophosphohydrolase [Bacillus shivajii]|nr:(deoxy)nucleoside triphosphate pyrophosphohydrolase [Bacillus shivajii]
MKKEVKVVGAIIENDHQQILCALRSPQMSMANMWEFPGGKVENNEDIFTALKREIQEELSCTIETTSEVFHEHIHEYDDIVIQLICIKTHIIAGSPVPREHAKLIWLKRDNLESLKWAPADVPAMKKLMEQK